MKNLLLLLLLYAGGCQAQSDVEVKHFGNGTYKVRADIHTPATADVVWDVLTDYEHISTFVSDMSSSKVISKPSQPLWVEQRGDASFLLFRFPIHVVFAIEPHPKRSLHFRSVGGNLRDMQGFYRLEPVPDGTHIHYETRFRPDFWVPPLISDTIMRREISQQFDDLVQETIRRESGNHTNAPSRQTEP